MKLLELISVLLCFCEALGGELGSSTAIATHHFSHWLDRDMFFNDSTIEKVNFAPSAFGFPDLPSWLNILPSKSGVGAFLYGSPDSVEDATRLQITATNPDKMKTVNHILEIKVAPKAAPAENFVELKVFNHALEDMLHDNVTSDLLRRVQTIWPRGGDVYIHKVTPYMAEDTGNKGVHVTVGGTRPFSDELRLLSNEEGNETCGVTYQPEEIDIHQKFAPAFDIDWCALKLIETRSNDVKPGPVTPRPDAMNDNGGAVTWHKRQRRKYCTDFMVTVVFPCVLAAVIVLILGYVMFGRREGLFKRNEKTPEEQLTQFNTIRRATANLRLFSDHRDSPHPLRIDPLYPRETYYMDTLPRQNLLSTNRPAPGTYSSPNQQTA